MAWDDIHGQALVKRLWQQHLADGRVSNAYLLVGPDGVGKRGLAIEMVKALNCAADGPRPCDRCACCTQIGRGSHPDIHHIVPSGASDAIRIDEVRQLLGRLALRPFSARVQVAVIEQVERFTEEAANSLLKALEEPSAHAHFLLTTSKLRDCLPTIVSRCHLMRCHPFDAATMAAMLIETHGCDPPIAQLMARLAGGSAARAMELGGRWDAYRAILTRVADGTPATWLEQPLPETRQDVTHLLDGMVAWLRDLAMAATGGTERIAHTTHAASARRQAARLDLDRCVETAFALMALRDSLEQFVSPRLVAALAREKWLSLTGVQS